MPARSAVHRKGLLIPSGSFSVDKGKKKKEIKGGFHIKYIFILDSISFVFKNVIYVYENIGFRVIMFKKKHT